MMKSWSATIKCFISDLENVGQGYPLQKSLYLSYYTNYFYQIFIEMKAVSSAINIYSNIFY